MIEILSVVGLLSSLAIVYLLIYKSSKKDVLEYKISISHGNSSCVFYTSDFKEIGGILYFVSDKKEIICKSNNYIITKIK